MQNLRLLHDICQIFKSNERKKRQKACERYALTVAASSGNGCTSGDKIGKSA